MTPSHPLFCCAMTGIPQNQVPEEGGFPNSFACLPPGAGSLFPREIGCGVDL